MKKGLHIITAGITVLICAYLAIAITHAFLPKPQFTVDLNDGQNITVYTYHDQGTPFPVECVEENRYTCQIPQGYWDKAYQLKITLNSEGNRIIEGKVNDTIIDSKNIVHVHDVSGLNGEFAESVVIRAPQEFTLKTIGVFTVVFFIMLYTANSLRKEIKTSKANRQYSVLLYDGSALKMINRKTIIIVLSGVLATALIAVGTDMNPIIGTMNLYGSGVDIYQLETTIDKRAQIELLLWSYNLPMLIFYFWGTIPAMIGKVFFNPEAYHLGYYMIYRILNGILLIASVISVLSFLLKHHFISEKKCKTAFIWSFFNPVTFYIAVIYIQLDAFPTYCLTLGILLLTELRFPVMTGVLLGIGLSCKQQNLLLFPLVAIMISYLIMKCWGKKRKALIKFFITWIETLVLCILPNFWRGTPLWLVMQYTPQSERAWWTTITYAPQLFLFITPGLLVLIMIAYLLNMNLQKSFEVVAINTLYMIGTIVLMFSFSIMSTPSTIIQCIAAFTLCYAFSKDGLQRLITGGLSVLMVFEVMFSSIGDILGLLSYWNFPYTFTKIEQSLAGTDSGVRYVSLIFTISHAAMLAYGIHFYKNSVKELKQSEKI